MRRVLNVVDLLVTYTLWDVKDKLLATAYTDGLARLAPISDDEDEAAILSDDEDEAALLTA